MDGEITVVPVGEIGEGVLACLCEAVTRTFGRRTGVGVALADPGYAFNPRRQQYSARAILECLPAGNAERVLGVVDQDLYVLSMTFVFGLADLAGRRALVALPRLRDRFYGRRHDEACFRVRVIKEALHELGHTYGLEHCREKLRVMAFSNSLSDTDAKGQAFCQRCRKGVTV
jgi:archaemetzincin